MSFIIGQYYRTKAGYKAYLAADVGESPRPLGVAHRYIGWVYDGHSKLPCSWDEEGSAFRLGSAYNIATKWQPSTDALNVTMDELQAKAFSKTNGSDDGWITWRGASHICPIYNKETMVEAIYYNEDYKPYRAKADRVDWSIVQCYRVIPQPRPEVIEPLMINESWGMLDSYIGKKVNELIADRNYLLREGS